MYRFCVFDMYKMYIDFLECVFVVKIQNDLDKEIEIELKDQGIEF